MYLISLHWVFHVICCVNLQNKKFLHIGCLMAMGLVKGAVEFPFSHLQCMIICVERIYILLQ